jgi:hypothetical protein
MSDDSISLDDADWEFVSDDWWHTSLSIAPCPLSWIDPEPPQTRQRPRSEVAARNSHYWHELLLIITKCIQGVAVCCSSCQEWRYIDGGRTFVCDAMKEVGVQDLDLNPDLVGVKMVLTMVDELERAVGFTTAEHHTTGEIATLARRVSQLLGNAQPVVNPEDSWNECTATVLDGDGIAPHGVAIYRPDLNADPPPADSITPILDLDLDPPRRKSPRFPREVIDLTDSEQSVASEAPPATPKPERSFATGGDGTMPGTLSSFVIYLILTCTLLHTSSQEIYLNATLFESRHLLQSRTLPVLPLLPTGFVQSRHTRDAAHYRLVTSTKRTTMSRLALNPRRPRTPISRFSWLRPLTA